jgi:hypothetical protein
MYVHAPILEAPTPIVFMVWLRTYVLCTALRTTVYISDSITILCWVTQYRICTIIYLLTLEIT